MSIAAEFNPFRIECPCKDANHFGLDKQDNCDSLPEVDRALEAGEPVAVVGYARPMREIVRAAGEHEAVAIDDRYFVLLRADRDRLTSLGFRFNLDHRP